MNSNNRDCTHDFVLGKREKGGALGESRQEAGSREEKAWWVRREGKRKEQHVSCEILKFGLHEKT